MGPRPPACRPKNEWGHMSTANYEIEDKVSLKVKLLRWLFSDADRRRADRHFSPGLVAFYFTGGAPHSYKVGTISVTGFFLITKERWVPETRLQMTIQKADGAQNGKTPSISVVAEVVCWGSDGVGFKFVISGPDDSVRRDVLPGEPVSNEAIKRFLQQVELT
jgi:hypothetical protein